MRYSFWHGRPSKTDLEWLNDAVSSLHRNEYTKPLYFDGVHWAGDDSQRQHAAIMLLNALRHNTSSQRLVFQNAPLDLKAQAALAQSMRDNKSLTNLTLKQLTNGDDCNDDDDDSNDASSSPPLTLPTGIFENPYLESLTIAQCRLDYSACLALAHMIHPDPSTTTTTTSTSTNRFNTLSLKQVDICPDGLPHLFFAIAQSSTLHHLKLQHLSWKSATAIAAATAVESTEDLDVSNDAAIVAATTREFLTTAAALNTSLVSLSLEHMQLNSALVQDVAAVLQRNAANLQELSLRHNDLNGDAVKLLVQDGLVHNDKLQRLFLSHNPVGDDGAMHLMQGLVDSGNDTTRSKINTALRELCLVETEIWQAGCKTILHGLRVGCRSLRKVHLDRNNLEACGPLAILDMLQDNMVVYSLLEQTLPLLLRKQVCNSTAYYAHWRQVDFMLRSNKARRRFFMQQQYEGVVASAAATESSSSPLMSPSLLVPLVLTLQDASGTSASSQPDVLFSFLSACLPQTLMSRAVTATSTSDDNPQEQMVLQQQQQDDASPPSSPIASCGMKRRLRMGAGSPSCLPVIARIRRSSTPPSA
jgi:hypothetical protein